MSDKPDQLLVEQTQTGHLEAFGPLVKKYQRKIYQIAYHFTRNVDEANDLAQEVFLKAFRVLPNFESSATFYTWLYRIAHNAGIDYVRRESNRPEYLFSNNFPTDESSIHPQVTNTQIVTEAEASEIQDLIKQAVAELSPRQQQVFVLRYYQDLPLREIGEMMGLQTGTIKSHLFKALRNLRQQLAGYMSV